MPSKPTSRVLRPRSFSAGLRKIWASLAPFPPAWRTAKVANVGTRSFVGGIAESTILVLLTLTADGLIRGSDAVEVAGISLSQTHAVLLALLLVLSRIVTTIGAPVISARFSAQVTGLAQNKVMETYLCIPYSARASLSPGVLNTEMISRTQFTGALASGFTVVALSFCGLLAFGNTSLIVNPVAPLGIAAIGLVVLGLMRPLRTRSRAEACSLAVPWSTIGLGDQIHDVVPGRRSVDTLTFDLYPKPLAARSIYRRTRAVQYRRASRLDCNG